MPPQRVPGLWKELTTNMSVSVIALVVCATSLLSCSDKGENQYPKAPAAAPKTELAVIEEALELTAAQVLEKPELVHARLRKANPGYTDEAAFERMEDLGFVGDLSGAPAVTDISPLKGVPFEALDVRGLGVSDVAALNGMPLRVLFLEETRVADLTPLAGMELEKLYLNNTPVRDLSPLAGMPLVELNLFGTPIAGLSPLRGMPLESLWLNGTSVTDISPLSECPLVSLTLEGTKVSDLSALSGITSLQRLHIAGTPVTDLTPLKDLRLTRLIFSPATVTKGLDIIREMATITELGTTFDRQMQPEQFWALYDQGKLK